MLLKSEANIASPRASLSYRKLGSAFPPKCLCLYRKRGGDRKDKDGDIIKSNPPPRHGEADRRKTVNSPWPLQTPVMNKFLPALCDWRIDTDPGNDVVHRCRGLFVVPHALSLFCPFEVECERATRIRGHSCPWLALAALSVEFGSLVLRLVPGQKTLPRLLEGFYRLHLRV